MLQKSIRKKIMLIVTLELSKYKRRARYRLVVLQRAALRYTVKAYLARCSYSERENLHCMRERCGEKE